MSNIMKIIIPLLNDDLELKDIQPCSGFVDAYYKDINRPALDNHIFLMYDYKSTGDNLACCLYKLGKLNNLYSLKVYYINNKPYFVYTFTIDKTIRNLRDGLIILTSKQKQRVLDFWGSKDAWISNNILLGTTYDDPGHAVLPEEDYAPSFGDEEGDVLQIECAPHFRLLV